MDLGRGVLQSGKHGDGSVSLLKKMQTKKLAAKITSSGVKMTFVFLSGLLW